MMITVYKFVGVTLVLLVTAVIHYSQDRKAVISFCNLSVGKEVNESNTYFTDSYKFRLDQDGLPKEIVAHQAKFTRVEDVTACLADWKFKGFARPSLFIVFFKWDHGVGWSEMRIGTKGFSQTITQRLTEVGP
jgi:hypothetical protein